MDILLDTSAYSLLRRNHQPTLEIVRYAATVLMSPIVMGELYSGFANGRLKAENEQNLEQFLLSTRVELKEVTVETAERYARIFDYLRKNGKPIPTNDIWIAASCMEHSAELISADKHFSFIPHIIFKQVVVD